MAETYSKAIKWKGNDDINIPQFPHYMSGVNGGAGGTTLIDLTANFLGEGGVTIGDVVIPIRQSATYPKGNQDEDAVQVAEVVSNTELLLTDVVAAGRIYHIHRSNGGINNNLLGNEGYVFNVNRFSDCAYIPASVAENTEDGSVVYLANNLTNSFDTPVKVQRLLDYPAGSFIEYVVFDN